MTKIYSGIEYGVKKRFESYGSHYWTGCRPEQTRQLHVAQVLVSLIPGKVDCLCKRKVFWGA